jgi:tetratricopeptide (TPR) repeat protein
LYSTLIGQWRHTLFTDKMSAAMQVAERVYSLAQEQNDPALMIWPYNALSCTLIFLGDFESAQQYAMRAVQIWRAGTGEPYPQNVDTPVVGCLDLLAMSKWYLGEIATCQAKMDESISLARELKDTHALANALAWAATLAYKERKPAEVDRLASELIELSERHNFGYWMAIGAIRRGWARSASGYTAEGITWIEQGIRDIRATGAVVGLPHYLALKADALHLADRTAEALEAINEAEALAERFEHRSVFSELHQLRAVFLAAMGAEESKIEASFCAAIKIAKEQKSVSLEKRAEATYAEYCRQKASGSGGRGFRLPLF